MFTKFPGDMKCKFYCLHLLLFSSLINFNKSDFFFPSFAFVHFRKLLQNIGQLQASLLYPNYNDPLLFQTKAEDEQRLVFVFPSLLIMAWPLQCYCSQTSAKHSLISLFIVIIDLKHKITG